MLKGILGYLTIIFKQILAFKNQVHSVFLWVHLGLKATFSTRQYPPSFLEPDLLGRVPYLQQKRLKRS